MIVKSVEIRDANTFIPALAMRMRPEGEKQRYLLGCVGLQADAWQVLLVKLSSAESRMDAYGWDSRTMKAAHRHIVDHWDELEDGAVVDVQFILGETQEPKRSQARMLGAAA